MKPRAAGSATHQTSGTHQDTAENSKQLIPQSSGRLAIRCIRPDLSADRDHDEREMSRIGVQLGYAVDETVVELDPPREGIYTTVMLALRRSQADAVIVVDLEHVDSIDGAIRERAVLITVEGEHVLERAVAGAMRERS
ncbi:hypothetical protein ABIA39_009054 [Nocardia sp. GAS34]|uniref:hypothetical protein n=1 Tax=unclassified Nocardia TaxID=2637762 RepID=UPI003D1B7EDB